MANRCEMCEKKSSMGRSHTHHTGVAGGQWKKRAQTTTRSFKPNLHVISMQIKGVMTTLKACTKCIKRARFDQLRRLSKASSARQVKFDLAKV